MNLTKRINLLINIIIFIFFDIVLKNYYTSKTLIFPKNISRIKRKTIRIQKNRLYSLICISLA